MMNEIRRSYGRLDILVNNAGTTKFIDHRRLEALTPEIFDEIYRINLRGPFLVVRAGLPLLMRSRAPLVVNIASIAALTAVGSNIAYCASKAALVNMTMSLARALAPKIRVNAISPGLTETGLMKGWKAYKAEQLKKTPLKRLATGDDIANVVIALATSLSYITGENIIVDGGRVLNC
jgi:3-oxoacyl-[acyl-carrier protein] reductase